MKRGKLIILLLTFLFAAVAVVFGRNEIGMRNFPFSVIVSADGVEEELFCRKLTDGYYIFLPSYAEGERARICLNPVYDVFLDGQQLREDQLCTEFPVNTEIELYFRSAENEGYETFRFIRSANVATMYIDVSSGNMEYIHAEKGNSEAGWIKIYRADGTLDYTGNLETIKGRGNATWLGDKKAYSLELRQEADLLGMGKAGRWILLSNAYDESHLRNKIAFDMAKEAGMPYSPGCEWTDVYLNGEYAGLYLLSERNEVHPGRVDLDPNGGFLVAVEPQWRMEQQGYAYVQTDGNMAFRIHGGTMPQQTMQQILQSAENAIFSENGYDPETGKRWDELIDADSWARKYLMAEIFVNEDVGLASEYFFYQASDGVLYAGPIWDMDITFRDSDIPWQTHRAIIAGRPHLTGADSRNYFYGLLQKQEFRDTVKRLYREEFRPLLIRLLDGGLEEYQKEMLQAAMTNQARWQLRDPAQNIARMADFIQKRVAFLDSWWIQEEPFFLVQVQTHDRMWAFAVSPGETLEHLPEPENGVWYRSDTNALLDKTLPVDSDLVIFVKEDT